MEWIYHRIFLEKQDTLFIVCVSIIILIILITIFLVRKELHKSNYVNK